MIIIDEEFKNLIQPLTEDEFKGLEESIIKEGCRDKLVLWGNTLIDGHNRYEICQKHGIPFQTMQKDFASRDDVMLWMIDTQFSRRNLEAPDRILLAQKKAPILERLARKKVSETTAKSNSEKPRKATFSFVQMDKTEKAETENKPIIRPVSKPELKAEPKPTIQLVKQIQKPVPKEQPKPIHVREEIAKIAGVSSGTVARFEQVQKKKPELIDDIRKGEISINQAYQTVKREEKKQAVQEKIEEHANAQTGTIDIDKPNRKYNIVYADPPWQYWESGNKNQSLHYTTMTIDEICDLPVKNIADDDCILFMWVTYPILKDAFRVIESWGFTYSTCAFVWVKKNKIQNTPFIGCGAWTRANSELCLLATKGNILRLDASISQIIESPIEEHSKKPDIVRNLITKLVGELPRVELFCRNPADGWDVWGNEA